MLYILYGTDIEKSRENRQKLRNHYAKRDGALSVREMHGDDFSAAEFETILRSATLFHTKHVVVCIRLLENPDAESFVLGNIAAIADAPHLFIVWEEVIEKKIF